LGLTSQKAWKDYYEHTQLFGHGSHTDIILIPVLMEERRVRAISILNLALSKREIAPFIPGIFNFS
jgi:hypothetical protein